MVSMMFSIFLDYWKNLRSYVLNRWGNVVFTENDYQNNWSPHDLTAGVYFYRLDLKDSGRIFQGMFYIQ